MIRACIFDVFGTLVDWRTGIAEAAAPVFSRHGIAHDPFDFADRWRAEYQPGMEAVRSGGRGYVRLEVLHRENLDRALAGAGIDLPIAERDGLNESWTRLPPWPDVVEGLRAVRAKMLAAPCSNGSIALMARLARFGGLQWDAITGAEIARNYKPMAEVYHASAAALGFAPGEVMMVATHNDDLAAARAAGLLTGYFPRPLEYGPGRGRDLEPAQDWDIVAEDLPGLAAQLPG